MISFNSKTNKIRFSSRVSRTAGFRPGQSISVVAEGPNTFRIRSTARTSKRLNRAEYSVEKDGAMRISQNALKQLGVSSRRDNNTCILVSPGNIVVEM